MMIRREIELEDDMLNLYTGMLKEDVFLNELNENDKNLVVEIINVLLRDTARHKKTMEGIIQSAGN